MPIELREPMFLRGRKSILERAVIISCVLGALAMAAGWLLAFAIYATNRYLVDVQNFVIPLAWGVTSGLLLYRPLNYWNRRSWLWTAASIPVGFALLYLWAIWSQAGPTHLTYSTRMTQGMFGALLASGLLLVRPTQLHWLAYEMSIAAGAIPAVAFLAVERVNGTGIPGISREVANTIVSAALFGGWFGALSIPWGIPFWWPPADDHALAPPALLPGDFLD